VRVGAAGFGFFPIHVHVGVLWNLPTPSCTPHPRRCGVSRLDGIRGELAAAVRRANALYRRHPEPRPAVIGDSWDALERELDAAFEAEDRERALSAIRGWLAHIEAVLGGEQ